MSLENSENIECEMCGCFEEMEEYSPCCHAPLCYRHSVYVECSISGCEYNEYLRQCDLCFMINGGWVCEKCNMFLCADHNTERFSCDHS